MTEHAPHAGHTPLPRNHIVVMGVSGCGKSTVGALLCARLGLPYKDGDELHPQANINKMAAGIPLDDGDRLPWLTDCACWLRDSGGGILGCSALKRSYRDLIRSYVPDAAFVHLTGPEALLHQRMATRPGHFMAPAMLASQLETLEPLFDDEAGHAFDISLPPAELLGTITGWLGKGGVEKQ